MKLRINEAPDTYDIPTDAEIEAEMEAELKKRKQLAAKKRLLITDPVSAISQLKTDLYSVDLNKLEDMVEFMKTNSISYKYIVEDLIFNLKNAKEDVKLMLDVINDKVDIIHDYVFRKRNYGQSNPHNININTIISDIGDNKSVFNTWKKYYDVYLQGVEALNEYNEFIDTDAFYKYLKNKTEKNSSRERIISDLNEIAKAIDGRDTHNIQWHDETATVQLYYSDMPSKKLETLTRKYLDQNLNKYPDIDFLYARRYREYESPFYGPCLIFKVPFSKNK